VQPRPFLHSVFGTPSSPNKVFVKTALRMTDYPRRNNRHDAENHGNVKCNQRGIFIQSLDTLSSDWPCRTGPSVHVSGMMIHFDPNVILASLYGLDKINLWEYLEKRVESKYVKV
jgi:hypothetical protein